MSTTATNLADIVSSPRAVVALKSAGYVALEDVTDAHGLLAIPYIGETTVAEIVAAGNPSARPAEAPAAQPDPKDVEECGLALQMSSPFGSLSIRLTESQTVQEGKRSRIINPRFIKFSGGEARLTKKMWGLLKFDGNPSAMRDFLASDSPWRVEAAAWLRNKPSYRTGSFIIKD